MTREQCEALISAVARYPDSANGYAYDEVLDEVHERARERGSLGKADIGALLLWKRLNLNTRWAKALNNEQDKDVREITAEAISLASDGPIPDAAGKARTALLPLPGCANGAAVASTILTAALPDRMAVYDRHAANTLATLGFEHPGKKYSVYMTAVCEVARQLSEHSQREWSPRDVDKALFASAGVTTV